MILNYLNVFKNISLQRYVSKKEILYVLILFLKVDFKDNKKYKT